MDISEENYQKAIAVVRDTSSGSVSNLQRKLYWGYCRAAAAIDRMQKEFIVSPMSASGRRDVYPSDIHQLWKELQAAKTQAVPEGFVLVLREPTEEMLGTAWEAPPAGGPSDNRRTFYERQAVVYKAMVEEAEKEMIEVQEQGHD